MVPAMRRANLVSFRQRSMQPSLSGFNVTEQWVEVCQAWVSIAPNRGGEADRSGEKVAVVTHTVRGDYLELNQVTPAMCMLLHPSGVYSPLPAGVRWFDIKAVLPEEDFRSDIQIKVEEKRQGYGV